MRRFHCKAICPYYSVPHELKNHRLFIALRENILANSIRRRLLFTLLITISLVSSLTLLLSYYDAQHEVEELFDAQLAQSAKVLQALLLPELLQGDPVRLQSLSHFSESFPVVIDSEGEAGAYGHEYERKLAFQVWDSKKNLINQKKHHVSFEPWLFR